MKKNASQLVFHKYQALGNDFILLDLSRVAVDDPAGLSRRLCRRHVGIGADGLILAAPEPGCDGRMLFFNPDGSRAEMCGNGIRCLARFLWDTHGISKETLQINTDTGLRELCRVPEGIAVNLGKPAWTADALPTTLPTEHDHAIPLPVTGFDLPPATCLSVGNPHCVFFVDDLDRIPVTDVGPAVECLPVFPQRINVIFACQTGPGELVCRVWERGAGETQACGTGAAASVVAGTLTGRLSGQAKVKLPGGELLVNWHRDAGVSIAGPAEPVFCGTVPLPLFDLAQV